ncbi:MAG TPA: serine/threonine-protein kinase [Pseudonocardiaceae bacterium]|jgi:serine/threonine-protein kinase
MTAPASLVAALPQYAIGERIGSGGMGVVYAGVHRSLGRHVAIKQLPSELVDHPGADTRFDREAKVLASLDHPHIVPVYDYVRSGRDRLLVMEKLDGRTVFDYFNDASLTGEQVCAIGLAMLAGLHAAHNAGVLHLDVKPKNLLFTRQRVLKVADFGIATVISEGTTLVTHGGDVLGTPAYIAPEQASGNPLTPAADIYSAGTVLYELLSGRLPFDGSGGALSMMRKHIFGDPKPITGVPEPLAGVIMHSLARDTADRYRDAEAFAVDLAVAATTTYGPGWLERSGIPVHLSGRVLDGLARTEPQQWRPTPRPISRPAPDPTLTATRTGPTPRSGKPVLIPAVISLVAAIVLVALAFLTPATRTYPAGPALLVDGTPIAAGVVADLSRQITVTGQAIGTGPFQLGLSLSAAGVPLGSSPNTTVQPDPSGHFAATVQLPAVTRWIVGGAVTGALTQSRPGQPATVAQFTVNTKQASIASAMGAGALLLALFAAAYIESTLRAVRRGHRPRGAPVTGAVQGALFGGSLWLLVSVLIRHQPTGLYGWGCALAGAVAAVGIVLATQGRRQARAGE